ncbi:metallophosphoesterase family protein [Olsenella sp. YH-ols2217]|uniref:Metallophosphoesterase family protein n=1 Tax=Kribbibacterium absianum TaxID=3044210 RepID=A0ABT6ZI04_9ACTN|nr:MULTISPECIES: metallophosphoesterase family protein [unclassified Olsenella]MDJ1121197.1 metallophosphoesterase family protein [Olsenella sp. YH-ols2216]MDJ1128688.1 metallophosphoesterase family protein [Olsenella sp. YH-ols2217]
MATYVLSDVHGHYRALDDALSIASPGEEDRVVVLGDLMDRGPQSREVVRLVRSLPNATVLRGNHEDLFLASVADPDDEQAWYNWVINGGGMTVESLMDMPPEAYEDLVRWVKGLPLFETVTVNGRIHVLTHAGILPIRAEAPEGEWTERALHEELAKQPAETFTWVRGEFWDAPTGLVDENGAGPLVVAGHTPVTYLPTLTSSLDRLPLDENGRGRIVRVGASAETGGVADKVCVDCAAAAGFPTGQVGILRLDDGAEFYAPIKENE